MSGQGNIPKRRDDYRRYFDYASDSEREDEFFDTGYTTDFRYLARSRYEGDDFLRLEQRGTMSWDQDAAVADRGIAPVPRPRDSQEGGARPRVPLPQNIKDAQEEQKLQEFRDDPFDYVGRHMTGIFPSIFRMKMLCLLLLLLLPVFQFSISRLEENIAYGHESVLALYLDSTGVINPVAYALHGSFYVLVGMFLGFSFFLLSILPQKIKKLVRRALCLIIAVLYFTRAVNFLGSFGDLSGESLLTVLVFLVLSLLVMSFMIVAELGMLFIVAGPYLSGTYGILMLSTRTIKLSFFLFVFYVFDAIGSLSTNFLSFVLFSLFLFIFVQLGLQLCETQQLHKENSVAVIYRFEKMVLVPSEDRNVDSLKDGFPQYVNLTLMNLALISVLALVIYYSSELIAFFLNPGLRDSIEISSMAGKLIGISTVLGFLLFLKLFFGAPSDKIDRKVFKRRRLERILSDKKSAFYVESTVSTEQGKD